MFLPTMRKANLSHFNAVKNIPFVDSRIILDILELIHFRLYLSVIQHRTNSQSYLHYSNHTSSLYNSLLSAFLTGTFLEDTLSSR